MNKNYTIFNQEHISDFNSVEDDFDAIDFLKNQENFRPFNQGLTEILEKKGFSGDINNTDEKSDFLISKLKEIHSNIENETVYSWFAGTHSPKIEPGSRKRIYEICFALHLTYEEVLWFFQHVYYDRCFNCHTIDESVFYYCFLHGISYQEALQIITTINNAPDSDNNTNQDSLEDETEPNYTQFIQNRISTMENVEELQIFLIENKHTFKSWNKSALREIKELLYEITGSEDSKPIIDHLKRTLTKKMKSQNTIRHLNDVTIPNLSLCGLLIREIYYDALADGMSTTEYILEAINGKNTFKNTFVLDRLLCTVNGMKKKSDAPYIIKNNFPSKKVISDILDESKSGISKSYDAIRKALILFDFYVFWCQVKLNTSDNSEYNSEYAEYDKEELYEMYKDEAEFRLYQCGYEGLYAGNPYDWLFLCAAKNEEPLAFFRACVFDLLPEE